MFGVNDGLWQERWPHHRSPYGRVALIVTAVHFLLFVFAPPFHFKPYRLEAQEVMIVEEIPDIEIPPAVPEEPRMPVEVDPWRGPVDNDPVVPPNVGDREWEWVPPKAPATTGRDFIPFDQPPVLEKFAVPAYSEMARETGIEGIVMVKVQIDEKGNVVAASILSSEVTDSMNRAALAAAFRCKFEPAKQRDKPVPVVVVIPFEFRLENH